MQTFFSQGESATSVFYLQSGSARLTIVAADGQEATITLLAAGDFLGEESLASVGALHMATATATTDCTAFEIDRGEMLRAMREKPALNAMFIQFLLARGMRIQSDLVDQLFSSSEKRLATKPLMMAEFGETGRLGALIPYISEEGLAEALSTTKDRISFFMNRFRDLGLIDYDVRIRVHRALLHVILHNEFPDGNVAPPSIIDRSQRHSRLAESIH